MVFLFGILNLDGNFMRNYIALVTLGICMLSGCDSGGATKSVDPIKSETKIYSTFPDAYAGFQRKTGGACGFDQPKTEGENYYFSGWATISAKDGILAETIVIGLLNGNMENFVIPSKQKRQDVADYFKSPSLLNSGFSVYLDKKYLSSASKVVAYQVFQGGIYACEVTATL